MGRKELMTVAPVCKYLAVFDRVEAEMTAAGHFAIRPDVDPAVAARLTEAIPGALATAKAFYHKSAERNAWTAREAEKRAVIFVKTAAHSAAQTARGERLTPQV